MSKKVYEGRGDFVCRLSLADI